MVSWLLAYVGGLLVVEQQAGVGIVRVVVEWAEVGIV